MFGIRRSALVLVVMATACATTPAPQTDAQPATAATRTAKVQNIITKEELSDPAIESRDAQYAIQQLRPAWFRTRGTQTLRSVDPAAAPGQVKVSQDFGPLQAVSALTGLEIRNVIEMRYLDSNEAQARFGINANGGPVIILLSTKAP
ncbi:MAG: hypothetical protein V4550_11250 [Gemmatimonadota bacterium]